MAAVDHGRVLEMLTTLAAGAGVNLLGFADVEFDELAEVARVSGFSVEDVPRHAAGDEDHAVAGFEVEVCVNAAGRSSYRVAELAAMVHERLATAEPLKDAGPAHIVTVAPGSVATTYSARADANRHLMLATVRSRWHVQRVSGTSIAVH